MLGVCFFFFVQLLISWFCLKLWTILTKIKLQSNVVWISTACDRKKALLESDWHLNLWNFEGF